MRVFWGHFGDLWDFEQLEAVFVRVLHLLETTRREGESVQSDLRLDLFPQCCKSTEQPSTLPLLEILDECNTDASKKFHNTERSCPKR